ncbi:MAG: hypothetical protein PHH77_01900 [Victivallaceae bacterium]|nr:hypothetical protein [Victivallaceae bacterium]
MKCLFLFAGIITSAFCLTPVVTAADPAPAAAAVKAEEKVVTGTLSVTKNEDDAVASAKIASDDVAYNIVLDENGKKLAKDMEDKKVTVTGTVETKEVKDDESETGKKTELWLTVKSFSAVVEKEKSSDSEE